MKSSARRPDPVAVAVFAKAPVPGRVKTRLAGAIGADQAARLHERLVERTLATAVEAALDGVELWCAPDASHDFFGRSAARFGASLHVQQGEDLGARMANAFDAARRGGRRLVLVGCDCPALEARDLRDAAAALDSHDAVIAPAEDGGYVLVGLAASAPGLFDAIAWGGADVMRLTRERAIAAGVSLKELRTLWDLDRPEDLDRFTRAGGWP